MTTNAKLAALAGDYWDFHLREHPAVAQELGDRRAPRELFRESITDYARRDAETARLLDGLRALQRAALPSDAHQQSSAGSLTGEDAFTCRLLERELQEAREHFTFQSHLRPMMFPNGPETQAAFVIGKTGIANVADADDYVARVATLPGMFDDYRERLWAGVEAGYRLPDVVLPRMTGAAESYLRSEVERSVWYKPLAAPPGGDSSRFDRARSELRELITQKVQPAYRNWIDMLREQYAKHCRSSIGMSEEPEGAAYYAFLTRHHTTTSLTPQEIHAIGREEVTRVRAEMETVAGRTGIDGDLESLRTALGRDASFVSKSAQELRERVEVLAKRIERRIPEFFGRLPRMTYGVESIPEALAAQVPPAYAQPNPANGRTSGVFWVTSLPAACPSYLHVALTMHEAWPGHLMHIALIQEMESLPDFRRYGLSGYSAYVEGWALYCERLGHEFGLLDDPYAHYGRLEMEMWRAVRLVVDTGIHAMNWTRPQAVACMREHLTLPLPTIEAEVDRYIAWPGQALAYKLGEIRIHELRERAMRELGTRFDLRAFHDRLIDCGPVTLDLLDDHLQSWIDSSRVAAA